MASLPYITSSCSCTCPSPLIHGGAQVSRQSDAAAMRSDSSLSCSVSNGGVAWDLFRGRSDITVPSRGSRSRTSTGTGIGIVITRAAASKQKKRPKEKKSGSSSSSSSSKSDPGGGKQWKFDELMLVWDDVFNKACESTARATELYDLARDGFARHGRGCVLVEEAVVTRPWGAASGFTFKSRYTSTSAPQLPTYSSVEWSAKYVPKEFILDPSKAPESGNSPDDSKDEEGAVQLVNQGVLMSVLRGMDRTRLLGLLAEPETQVSKDAGARDVGGEAPCDPSEDELVIMLVLFVDRQPAVGADVLKAYPTVDDRNSSSNSGNLWTLKLRDDLPS